MYLLRLSKKSYFSIFPNFAYNKIKYLEAPKSPILGFSTVSLCICPQQPFQALVIHKRYIYRWPLWKNCHFPVRLPNCPSGCLSASFLAILVHPYHRLQAGCHLTIDLLFNEQKSPLLNRVSKLTAKKSDLARFTHKTQKAFSVEMPETLYFYWWAVKESNLQPTD